MTTGQCANPALHPPHDDCAGLDGTEVTQTINPFLVACPDCHAHPGERCRIRLDRIPNDDGNAVHANRRDSARLRTAIRGTCALCGRFMVRALDPDQAWHPERDLAGELIPPCPPYPETTSLWTPTGLESFVPDPVQPDPPAPQLNPPPPLHLALPPGVVLAHSDPMQDPPGSTV